MKIEDIIKVLWRRKFYILLPFLMVPIVSTIVVFQLPKEYQSHATVFIDQSKIEHPILLEYNMKLRLEERLPTIKKLMKGKKNLPLILGETVPIKITKDYLTNIEQKKERMLIELKGPGVAKMIFSSSDPKKAQDVVKRMAQSFIDISLLPFEGIGLKLMKKLKQRDEVLLTQLLPKLTEVQNKYLELQVNYTEQSPELQLAKYEYENGLEKVRIREKELEKKSFEFIPLEGENLDMTQVASVIEPATLPLTPFKPNIPKTIVLALISGLSLGFILTFIMEFLDHSLKENMDIENYLSLPVLGRIPKINEV